MTKIKIMRNLSIKGVHHAAGKMAEVTEDEARNLVGMGKASYDHAKSEVKKKKKK
jgi:hypothetical protein